MHAKAHLTPAQATDLFDPALYPRKYRVSARSRAVYLLLGGVVAAAGLAGMWYFATGHESKTAEEAMMLTAVCFAFVILGGVLILYMLTSKIVLYADAVEVRDFLLVRKLRREDIAGRRLIDGHYVSVLALVPKRAEAKKLKITQIMQTDAVFDAWVATLPDLDAQELEKSASEITASRDLGRTSEERLARLATARKVGKVLNAISVVVCLWVFFLPEPYEVAIAALAALPPLAVLYQLVGRTNDARANIAAVFIIPAVVLALRVILDIQLYDWVPALLATVVAAFVLTFILAATDAELRRRGWELLAMFFISLAYPYGAVLEANALLDRSPPQVFEATVVGKHKSSGKTTTYYLRLKPWGPRAEDDDVSVSGELYDATAPGQQVCVVFRNGALEIPWFVVSDCGQ